MPTDLNTLNGVRKRSRKRQIDWNVKSAEMRKDPVKKAGRKGKTPVRKLAATLSAPNRNFGSFVQRKFFIGFLFPYTL